MNKYLMSAGAALLLPFIAYASWWNPLTWIPSHSQGNVTDSGVERPLNTAVSSGSPSSQSDDGLVSSVERENALLKTQNDSLEERLSRTPSPAAPAPCSSSAPSQPAAAASPTPQAPSNSEQIGKINVELAYLDTIDSDIDTENPAALINVVNNALTLPDDYPLVDDKLFDTNLNQQYKEVPDHAWLHNAVQIYRSELQLRLAILEN